MALLRNSSGIFLRLQGGHGVATTLTLKDGITVEMDWPSLGEELRDFAYPRQD
ncbi:hypothetical protein [Corynebacterium cystitidis]|uniref:hypothetical protein n=1 Tax=Corynebacterium cystitidis TaxID=35757 RepID=UPI00211E8DDB|nr:hypothetical protein [Corynebacterium cystitidis]